MTDKLQRGGVWSTRATQAAVCLLTYVAISPAGQAQTPVFKSLYSFTGGTDGGDPVGTPLLNSGFLFSATYHGGGPNSPNFGSIFQFLPASGLGSYYYVFQGQPNDGQYPMGGLVADPYGDFYGTTSQGGFQEVGTIYQITGGTEYVLYNFSGPDGASPQGGLIMDADGNLYGTTTLGGAYQSGTVFAFTTGYSLVTLHDFGAHRKDGLGPGPNLFLSKGSLYGVTTQGGEHNWGTIFGINIRNKTETILYNFRGGPNGGTPVGGLVGDRMGNLYGTTTVGGSANSTAGNGIIFMINIENQFLTVVHTFQGTDGSQPTGGLITDGNGNFFGTTYAGGAYGYGTIFEFNESGTFTTLYNFKNGADGAYPNSALTMDSSGNLYGAAPQGGTYHWGTLFEVTP